MDKASEYAAALQELRELEGRRDKAWEELNAAYARDQVAWYRKVAPGKVFKPAAAKQCDGWAEFVQAWTGDGGRADRFSRSWRRRLSKAEARLKKLANALLLKPGTHWVTAATVSEQQFMSMGSRSHAYGRAAAALIALEAEAHGIPARVRDRLTRFDTPVTTPGGRSVAGYRSWDVLVPLSEAEADALRRKDSVVSMATAVKWCVKNAVSPRVMFPGLSAGDVERLCASVN